MFPALRAVCLIGLALLPVHIFGQTKDELQPIHSELPKSLEPQSDEPLKTTESGQAPIRTVYLSGRLVTSTATPVPNATVTLRPSNGQNSSMIRTAENGRFAFSVEARRGYTLRFEAPGFKALDSSGRTTAVGLDLNDIVAEADTISTTQFHRSDDLPADLLNQVKSDLGLPDVQDCVQESGEVFEQMIRTTQMILTNVYNRAILVEGLGSCFGGANNGPLLVYVRFGKGWRKVFDESGTELDRSPHRTHGYFDLIRWQHSSAFESVRFTYQFDGVNYRDTACNVVKFLDRESAKEYPKPRYAPCGWDWKDRKQNRQTKDH
jgi:Carboxypeptidase regulatory-like domain